MADVEDYSTTAASNTTDFPEGQAPSTVNNAGRETQADIAAMYQRDNAVITATGTADALIGTFSPAHAADVAGRVVIIQAASDNATTTPTFQLDSLTARTITKDGGAALIAGDIKTDAFIILKYDLTNTAWELLNPARPLSAAQGISVDLISSRTASASPVIDFTNLSSTYISYHLVLTNVAPATDIVDLQIQVSTDNGATFLVGTGYRFASRTRDQVGTEIPYSSATAGWIKLSHSQGNGTNEDLSGNIYIFNPGASKRTIISMDTTYADDNNQLTHFAGGGDNVTASPVDAIRLKMSSGNIASGEFRLYGLKGA